MFEYLSAEMRNAENTARGLRERAALSIKEAEQLEARIQELKEQINNSTRTFSVLPAKP
jgi:hypothetical protein